MAELDLETVEQVARWCAEAGRQATPAQIRAALGGLTWDELLAARALLADPPPARPLGPQALADLARGAPADVAAERERSGRYPAVAPAEAPPAVAGAPARPGPGRPRRKGRPSVIVRKKTPAPAPGAAPPRPLLDELLLPAGRATLERLVRAHGGRRPALLLALSASHRRPDGLPPGDPDLDRLLEHHGLTRSFARRERDEVLHAVRAAGGVLARAAAALGFHADGLAEAMARLGCEADVETIRAGKRRDLAARGTLSDRARLVIADPERLGELGLLEPFEAELRQRLPEHLRALARSGEPLALALARSLSLPVRGVRDLAARLGLELGPVTQAEAAAGDRPLPRFRPDDVGRPRRAARPPPGRDREDRPRPAKGRRPPPTTARPGETGARPGGRPAPTRRGPERAGPVRTGGGRGPGGPGRPGRRPPGSTGPDRGGATRPPAPRGPTARPAPRGSGPPRAPRAPKRRP